MLSLLRARGSIPGRGTKKLRSHKPWSTAKKDRKQERKGGREEEKQLHGVFKKKGKSDNCLWLWKSVFWKKFKWGSIIFFSCKILPYTVKILITKDCIFSSKSSFNHTTWFYREKYLPSHSVMMFCLVFNFGIYAEIKYVTFNYTYKTECKNIYNTDILKMGEWRDVKFSYSHSFIWKESTSISC